MSEVVVKKKKTRKERLRELRDDGFAKGGTVNYSVIHDRHKDDVRFERELEFKQKLQEESGKMEDEEGGAKAPSATYDAFMRMATGQQERTIQEKIADSNRPTWDQYKKDHEDKLEIAGAELKKMIEYRKQLDANREKALNDAKSRKEERSKEDEAAHSDDDGEKKKKKKKKKDKKKEKKKRKKKDKKKKKSKKKRKHKESEGSSESSSSDDDSSSEEDKKKKKKKKQKTEDEGPVRLSSFLGDGSDDDV